MKKIAIICIAVTLAACNTVQGPTVTKLEVVTPSNAMYDCPLLKTWPNYKTLKDVEVARTLVNLYKNNVRCKNSVEALKKFMNKAKSTVEGTSTRDAESNPALDQPNSESSGLFGWFGR